MDQITAQLKRQKQEIATGMQQMSRVEDKIQGQRDEQTEEMQKLYEEKAALDARIKELDNDIQEQAKEHTNAIRNISRRNERRAELVEKCTDAQEVYAREIRLTTKKNAESKRHQYNLKER
jgi:chromosome segregation ATPase